MRRRFAWIENRFSPAELAAASGLSPEMQRHWRRRGLLPKSTERIATFTAREIAIVRLMLLLEHPSKNRPVAEKVAPHVIWLALGQFPDSWKVEGPQEVAARFRDELELIGSDHFDAMSGVSKPCRYLVIGGREKIWLGNTIEAEAPVEGAEKFSVIDLEIAAAHLYRALNRKPLFTVLLPHDAKDTRRAKKA